MASSKIINSDLNLGTNHVPIGPENAIGHASKPMYLVSCQISFFFFFFF